MRAFGSQATNRLHGSPSLNLLIIYALHMVSSSRPLSPLGASRNAATEQKEMKFQDAKE